MILIPWLETGSGKKKSWKQRKYLCNGDHDIGTKDPEDIVEEKTAFLLLKNSDPKIGTFTGSTDRLRLV